MQRINLVGISILVLMLMACSKTTSNKTDPNQLLVALSSAPASLDPRWATDANGTYISELLFDSLVKLGPDLDLVKGAAKSFSFDANKTYEFLLHTNLKFSNGRAVTKEDIEFSFDEFTSPKSPFKSNLDSIDSVQVSESEEGLKVKIRLKEFSAKFLNSDLPAVKILPKKECLKLGDQFSSNPIGTGPFDLVGQNANEIRLQAKKFHPKQKAKISKLKFKIIRDDYTRYQKMLKGQLDIVQADLPLNRIKEFQKRSEDFNVSIYPGLSFTYVLINLRDPILSRKKIRRALSLGIHREEIIKFKLAGLAVPATSILTPNNPFRNNQLSSIVFDPNQARRLLKESGYENQEVLLKTSNSRRAVDNGRVLVNQLKAIGLNIKQQSYEWGTYYGDIKAGRFQLATMKWIGAFDPDIYRSSLHSKELPPGRNRGAYNNPGFDSLTVAGIKIEDRQKRIQHYKKVQEIVYKELPIIPLWYDQQVAVTHRRVKNYSPSLVGDFSPLLKVTK